MCRAIRAAARNPAPRGSEVDGRAAAHFQVDLEQASVRIERFGLETRLSFVDEVVADVEHAVAEAREFPAQVLRPLDAEVPVDDREDEDIGEPFARGGWAKAPGTAATLGATGDGAFLITRRIIALAAMPRCRAHGKSHVHPAAELERVCDGELQDT